MTKTFRSQVVLAVVVSLASAVGFAQAGGEATYKAKCASCHGATGTPSPAIALSVAAMSDAVTKGKGKMKPVAGLTPAQVKDVVTFYRGLK
jgi:mono/diheme cytochrome c family protein